MYEIRLRKHMPRAIVGFFLVLSALNVFAPCFSNADITTGLVGWWKFDEGTGTTVSDSSGRGHTAMADGATWVSGKIGPYAMSFDGVNDRVTIPTSTDFDAIGSAISISGWIYPSSSGTPARGTVISRCMTNDLHLWNILQTYSAGSAILKMEYVTRVGDSEAIWLYGPAYSLDTWHHFVAIKKADKTLVLYVDGVAYTSPGGTPTHPDPDLSGLPLYLGVLDSGGQYPFKGNIDDVRFYNRALSSTDILELYNYTGGIDDTPPSSPAGLRVAE